MREFPSSVPLPKEDVHATAALAGFAVALGEGVEEFATPMPDVGETLEPLVRLLKSGAEPRAAHEPAIRVVFGDEAEHGSVHILQRLDQAEHVAALLVDGDVFETQSQARRGNELVGLPTFEGEIDSRNPVEVVEDDQRRRVIDQRDPAGFQAAALVPAREQAEQLLLAHQFESLAHRLPTSRNSSTAVFRRR